MSGWTKGPWRWSHQFSTADGSPTWSLLGADNYGILSCDGDANSPQGLGDVGNACLISASPDMAEALEPIAAIDIDHIADLPDDDRVVHLKVGIRLGDIRRARAALAKAKGETIMTPRTIDTVQHAADAWELAARSREAEADRLEPFSPMAAAIGREMAADLRARAPTALSKARGETP